MLRIKQAAGEYAVYRREGEKVGSATVMEYWEVGSELLAVATEESVIFYPLANVRHFEVSTDEVIRKESE